MILLMWKSLGYGIFMKYAILKSIQNIKKYTK